MANKDKEISENSAYFFSEEMDEEILGKMPGWFKRLREAYLRKKN